MEALEHSGMPFSYFPEMIPHANGDHVIAPTPVTMETTRSETGGVLARCVEGRTCEDKNVRTSRGKKEII